MPKTLSLVVRYSDKFGDTITLHNKVAEEHGSVWFGKMGTTVALRPIQALKLQILQGPGAWLLIVKREGPRYVFHKANILEILKDSKPSELMPEYYFQNNLVQAMKIFFRIEPFKLCTAREIEKVRVLSSGSPVRETLASSMVGAFVVEITEFAQHSRPIA